MARAALTNHGALTNPAPQPQCLAHQQMGHARQPPSPRVRTTLTSSPGNTSHSASVAVSSCASGAPLPAGTGQENGLGCSSACAGGPFIPGQPGPKRCHFKHTHTTHAARPGRHSWINMHTHRRNSCALRGCTPSSWKIRLRKICRQERTQIMATLCRADTSLAASKRGGCKQQLRILAELAWYHPAC